MTWRVRALVTIVAMAHVQAQFGAAHAAQPSATITGVVIDAQTRARIGFASVRLTLPNGSGVVRSVTSDSDGTFTIGELSAGAYVLMAAKAGYLTATLGQQRPGGPGTPIVLREGETLDDVAIPMSRGGVITGRVVDDYGDPVAGVHVLAVPEHPDREPGPAGIGMNRTNDQGTFRLFMLPPGRYRVVAQQQLIRPPDWTGSFAPLIGSDPRSASMNRTDYVEVVAGRETAGVTLSLVPGNPARLAGRAVNARGEPLTNATVQLHNRVGGVSLGVTTVVGGNGAFEMTGIPPGDYALIAESRPNGGDDDVARGRTEIVAAGKDIDYITIVASRGAVLRGIVTTDNDEPVPPGALGVTIRLVLAAGESGEQIPPPTLSDAQTFEIRNLLGSYRVTVEMPKSAGLWALKSMRWRGEDVTYRPFAFRSGDVIEDVEVVLSDRWATLSGVLRDMSEAPIVDAPLVLFPVNEALWIPGGQYIREMRTDYQGRYGVSWLLAGEYFLAAPRDMAPDQWNDPGFLRLLVDGAARVTLVEEDDQIVDLRVRRRQ